MKTIAITGGTGFVGHYLIKELTKAGHKLVIFTRSPKHHPNHQSVTYALWNPQKEEIDTTVLPHIDVAINLAGAGIADKRWTDARKAAIVNSRVKGTSFLVNQLQQHAPACKTFISASAIGYYGPDRSGMIPYGEKAPAFNDFLGDTCSQWEAASEPAGQTMRRVVFRFGIVLGKGGGPFPQFEQPQSFGVVPILGNGKQVISWIEVNDLARLLHAAVDNDKWQGIYNAVSPHPVSNEELMRTIARIKGGIKIPFHVPGALLKIALGEMATEVLKSCTVSADKTLQTGFQYQYDTIDKAVKAILAS